MSQTPKKSARKQILPSDSYKTPNKKQSRPRLESIENLSTATEDEPDQDQARSIRKSAKRITPNKNISLLRLESIEKLSTGDEDESDQATTTTRKSGRKISPSKRYNENEFALELPGDKRKKQKGDQEDRRNATYIFSDSDEEDEAPAEIVVEKETQFFEDDLDVEGKRIYGFNTPKKRDGMALAAAATPKTPKTPKTPRNTSKTPDKKNRAALDPKTPSHVRNKVKTQIAKLLEDNSNSDFSADDSDFQPSPDSASASSAEDDDDESQPQDDEAEDDQPKKGRRPIIVPVLPKTPSASRVRRSAARKLNSEYVPESDGYFTTHSSNKIHTSDHTLDRLKNPRLPADKLFSLLASMTLSKEHEKAISGILDEYKTYFSKWMYILNEGFNILLYGLGSKRNLLQRFHREVLSKQTVLVVNGFFPSLTIKDILDSITNEILDVGTSPANPHEAVDIIEEEFGLIPETHLYLIVHNIDGTMLRNSKAQEILSRLATVPNIHLLASIDHINTPLLWNHTKLSNYNFSWWDVTTMLPYSDETAFENSLLVQNSGELALSSMRSVFSSLTQNARGIYMIVVKYQIKNKSNPNYQGMPFKDLYWSCREAFLVSSDLALRAQLTEFLDHKLVKSKRTLDGSEQLQIPIDSGLLQQFLDEQQK
ncbi:origin recognition complex subunit 2 [Episyrphus balteatus]|uniref:origin recognition complex subunit 2 n=1 Tax=Episyrphus balteatus TaxID=286459 RepID=UPI002484D7BA|nr:origin recognition complex subunit 2 [Episyrphus balteatus]